MIKFLHWFQTNYPEHKKALLASHHNFDDNDTNPYHIEGDCWSHTMMVCKIAELKGYDRVVKVSALLHDIGKPQSRKINPDNNHVQFFGHEELSAKMVEPLVADLVKREMLTLAEADEVLELIRLHGFLYKHSEKEIIEKFKGRYAFLKNLIALRECDDFGRFSEGMGKSNLDIKNILESVKDDKQDNFCLKLFL